MDTTNTQVIPEIRIRKGSDAPSMGEIKGTAPLASADSEGLSEIESCTADTDNEAALSDHITSPTLDDPFMNEAQLQDEGDDVTLHEHCDADVEGYDEQSDTPLGSPTKRAMSVGDATHDTSSANALEEHESDNAIVCQNSTSNNESAYNETVNGDGIPNEPTDGFDDSNSCIPPADGYICNSESYINDTENSEINAVDQQDESFAMQYGTTYDCQEGATHLTEGQDYYGAVQSNYDQAEYTQEYDYNQSYTGESVEGAAVPTGYEQFENEPGYDADMGYAYDQGDEAMDLTYMEENYSADTPDALAMNDHLDDFLEQSDSSNVQASGLTEAAPIPDKITINLPGSQFKHRSKSPSRQQAGDSWFTSDTSDTQAGVPKLKGPPRPPPPPTPSSKPGRPPAPPRPAPARQTQDDDWDTSNVTTGSPARPPPPKKSPARPAPPRRGKVGRPVVAVVTGSRNSLYYHC